MAKPSFNFGASAKPKKKKGAAKSKKGGSGKGGSKGSAWRAYVGAPAHSNAPIPE